MQILQMVVSVSAWTIGQAETVAQLLLAVLISTVVDTARQKTWIPQMVASASVTAPAHQMPGQEKVATSHLHAQCKIAIIMERRRMPTRLMGANVFA